MANLTDTSAYKALDEEKYINELYDKGQDTQKKLLQDNYTQNTGALDTEQERVERQTGDALERTYVEAAKGANIYAGGTGKTLSTGANQQAALSQGVTRQANVTDLKGQQDQADAEIQRQREILAGQYTAAIKQAQAENDMERAQALYEAAKEEDAQILQAKKEIGTALAEKGDLSVLASLLWKNGTDTEVTEEMKAAWEAANGGSGNAPAQTGAGTTVSGGAVTGAGTAPGSGVTPSWGEVTRNEGPINEIYDARAEAERQALLSDHLKAASDLEARRLQQQKQTDEDLTDAYVNALKGSKNYAEVQTAYGQGSGTNAQAQLARDNQLLRELTAIRAAGAAADGALGMEGLEQEKAYRDALAKANAENEQKRIDTLYEGAKGEENTLISNQQAVARFLAENQNNYALLGLLYGLTPDMVERLQGTGAYASSGGAGSIGKASALANLSNRDRKAYEEALRLAVQSGQ